MSEMFGAVDDFLHNDSFIAWVLKTDAGHIAHWEAWLAQNPEKAPLAHEAAQVLRKLQIREEPVSDTQVENARAKLLQAMNEAETTQPKTRTLTRRLAWYAAASVVLVTAVTLGFMLLGNKSKKPILASGYGQVMQNKLPDGSEIILNANSQLTRNQWKENGDREVWLNGEAFFKVQKTPERRRFIVHTDAFDIEVTGTSFNVINRDGKSSVVLKEGSVNIHRPGQPVLVMKPGDFVEFQNRQLNKKTVTGTDYLAWTENKLVFDNTPLNEVARTISEHYGISVTIEEKGLNGKTITGIMPNNNLEILLQALEATSEFTIQRNKENIIIGNKL